MKERKNTKPERRKKQRIKKKGRLVPGSNSFTVAEVIKREKRKKEEKRKLAEANNEKARRAREKKYNTEWEKAHPSKAEWKRNIKTSPSRTKVKRGRGRTVSITETEEDPLHRK